MGRRGRKDGLGLGQDSSIPSLLPPALGPVPLDNISPQTDILPRLHTRGIFSQRMNGQSCHGETYSPPFSLFLYSFWFIVILPLVWMDSGRKTLLPLPFLALVFLTFFLPTGRCWWFLSWMDWTGSVLHFHFSFLGLGENIWADGLSSMPV